MYEQAPTPLYMGGPGAPPPLPMALPGSYGTPMPIPPQAVTSSVPYDYGQQVNAVAQYNPMPMAASFGPPGAVLGGGKRITLPMASVQRTAVQCKFPLWSNC